MKKFVLMLFCACSAAQVFACDICGCGVGSYYIGILPDFNQEIIGLRHRYNSLRTHIGAGGVTSYLTTNETYNTAELWGGWNISSKWRVMAYLPVNFDEKQNQGNTYRKNGLGDAGAHVFYALVNKRKKAGAKLFVQSLYVGAGIKLPTGRYDRLQKELAAETVNTFQLGTGSTDFSANVMYDARLNDAGINATAGYKINTANKYAYRYGNKLSASLQGYYKLRLKHNLAIAPNTGILYEAAALDADEGTKMDVSGGRMLMGTLGLEAVFNKVSIGGSFQTPLSQYLAHGLVKAGNRAMLHASFLF